MNQQYFDVPILFLVFNRPDTTQEVFKKIKEIRPKRLFIAGDGPRENKVNDINLISDTRNIVNLIDWDCELFTLFRDTNLGCGVAVSSAISWFFEQNEFGIILEDDCLPDLSFFFFCKDLLIKYRNEKKIMLIGGNNFLNGEVKVESSYYFSQYPHIWGWASWHRAWKNYDYKMHELLRFERSVLPDLFKTNKQRSHLISLFRKVPLEKINTWDYQWHYSILLNNGLAITPIKNLVVNIGFRNQSTHSFLKDSLKEIENTDSIIFPLDHSKLCLNSEADFVTYQNVYSYSFSRLFRLLKENGILSIFKYILKKD